MSYNRVSQFSRYRSAKVFSWTALGMILVLNAPVIALAKEKGTQARIDRLEEQAEDTRDQIQREKNKLDRAQKDLDKAKNGGNDGEYSGDCNQPCMGDGCKSMRSKDKANISGGNNSGTEACLAIWRWARGDQFKIQPDRCWDSVMSCGTVARERALKAATQARDEAQEKVDNLTAEATALDRRADKLREDCKDCNRAGGGLYGGVGLIGSDNRDPTVGESIVAGLQAITPMVLGGLSTYQYSKGIKSYYGAYNNMLQQCVTIGVPCTPPGYGVGPGLFGNMGGIGGIGGIGIGGMGIGGLGIGGGIGGIGGGVIVGGFAIAGGLGGAGIGGVGIGGMPIGGLYGGYGSLTGGYGIATMPYGYGMATPMLPGYGLGGGIGGIGGGVIAGGFAIVGGLGGVGIGGMPIGGMGYDPYGMGGYGGLGMGIAGYGGVPYGGLPYGGIGYGGYPGAIAGGYGIAGGIAGGYPYGGIGYGGYPGTIAGGYGIAGGIAGGYPYGGIGISGYPGGVGISGYPGGIGISGYGPYMPGGTPGAYGGIGGAYGGIGGGFPTGYYGGGGYNPQYGMLQQASMQSSMLQMQRAQQGQQDLMMGAQQMQEAQSRYYNTLMQVQSFGGYGGGGYGRTF